MAKRLDDNGTLYLLSKLLLTFVRQEAGKGLSANDLTDALKEKILAQFSGDYDDLRNKPTIPTVPGDVSAFANDAGYQTAEQVAAAIETALSALDTNIFVIVDALPDPGDADPNKIYLAPAADGNAMEQWVIVNGAWQRVGAVSLDLTGYFNEENLVPVTNAEIDAMFAALAP